MNCSKTDKTIYESKKNADKALMMIWKHDDGESDKMPVRVYHCPFCKGWHLTSQRLKINNEDIQTEKRSDQ